jgi:predicted nuclease of predicted toxin-antitoxin system
VKFLVDECLPARLIEVLSTYGHDAVHVSECGLNGKPDTEVMALAAAEGRILLSADTDFGELLASAGSVAPSLILLRGLSGRPDARLHAMLDNLDQLEEYLQAGAIAVIGESRIRVRSLPLA